MAWYTFEAQIALDPNNPGTVAVNAEGQVYATTDTTFATPLAVQDLAGVPLTSLTSNAIGLIPAFQVEDHQIVVWKSGAYTVVLGSLQGFILTVNAAAQDAQDAETAALAAQVAAEAVGSAQDDAVAGYLTDPDSATRTALDSLNLGGGGSGAAGYEVIGPEDPIPGGLPADILVVRTQTVVA